MNICLDENSFTEFENSEIDMLLQRRSKSIISNLEQMWYLMDLIWEDFGCDNINLNWEKISKFYSHPVWLLNGLFIEQDSVSMNHRHEISDWIITNKIENIVDYGGGFGTLARLIAKKTPNINVNIYEPHPSEFGLKRSNEYSNITIIDKLNSHYDCIVCTDVLEHVPDPLSDLSIMIKSVKKGGYLVIANAFFPMIKCHLPQNFHFRYSFNFFAKKMGLEIAGSLNDDQAIIFKKLNNKILSWKKLRFYEKISILTFQIIKLFKSTNRTLIKILDK
jgi:ubiquinone/menaquinone biosynthesis C-methylase UbiE